jgi:hypothetical protein
LCKLEIIFSPLQFRTKLDAGYFSSPKILTLNVCESQESVSMSVGIGNIKNKKAIAHLFYEMPIKKLF